MAVAANYIVVSDGKNTVKPGFHTDGQRDSCVAWRHHSSRCVPSSRSRRKRGRVVNPTSANTSRSLEAHRIVGLAHHNVPASEPYD